MAPTDVQGSAGIQRQNAASAFVARNAKAVVSLLGGVINILAVSVALLQLAPPDVAAVGAALLTVMETLRTVNVWIIRNEPALEAKAVELAGVSGSEVA
ncbi:MULTISPECIES: hypothetical protein [unclassified Nocardia]|uniref:hypothetical protein n=1 Tax=unclassified Nocardia TaxID=2637762 RepID=UPI001CE3FF26|nr:MULTISPECIES: hypothetical protein [unclassified Nocardia]